MFPYLLFMSLVAMFSGILNSIGRFAVAASAPVVLNLVIILALTAGWLTGHVAPQTIGQIMGWAVSISGVLQLLLLTAALWKTGFLVLPARPAITPGIRRLLILTVPAALAGGITQINILAGQIIASQKDGAIAILQYADRIHQLPLGVVGIAIGVALLPDISRKLRARNL